MIWLLGTEFLHDHTELLFLRAFWPCGRETLLPPSGSLSVYQGARDLTRSSWAFTVHDKAAGDVRGLALMNFVYAQEEPIWHTVRVSPIPPWVLLVRLWCSYRGGPGSIPRVHPMPCSEAGAEKALLFAVAPLWGKMASEASLSLPPPLVSRYVAVAFLCDKG